MTYNDLLLLIDYHYWARDQVLGAVAALTTEQFVQPMGSSFSSVRDTLAHVCGGEQIWVSRLKGETPQGMPKLDRFADAEAVRREWADLEAEMRTQLARLGPEAVERALTYKDMRGNDQSDPMWQMVQHVVNHATYHRGQITTLLRQLGATPPQSMDLIAYYRWRARTA
ncbi:DUF664 domain-containing protein [Acidobacteria bacterium AB60]|nr:DUF664 domain-containing protein [Acidobacteria bacterium AB60]